MKKTLAGNGTSIVDNALRTTVTLRSSVPALQTLQMMSNISKMMHDTATAMIRKIGG